MDRDLLTILLIDLGLRDAIKRGWEVSGGGCSNDDDDEGVS